MKSPFNRGWLDYAFGIVWAMAVALPAIGIHASHRSSWLVLVAIIPALGFFLGWLLAQYRRSDWVGAQKQSWLTVHQRQGPHKRVRLIAACLAAETVVVFAASALARGDAIFLTIAATIFGAAAIAVVGAIWLLWRDDLTTDGWRW